MPSIVCNTELLMLFVLKLTNTHKNDKIPVNTVCYVLSEHKCLTKKMRLTVYWINAALSLILQVLVLLWTLWKLINSFLNQ